MGLDFAVTLTVLSKPGERFLTRSLLPYTQELPRNSRKDTENVGFFFSLFLPLQILCPLNVSTPESPFVFLSCSSIQSL